MKVVCCGERFELNKGSGVTCHCCRTIHQNKGGNLQRKPLVCADKKETR